MNKHMIELVGKCEVDDTCVFRQSARKWVRYSRSSQDNLYYPNSRELVLGEIYEVYETRYSPYDNDPSRVYILDVSGVGKNRTKNTLAGYSTSFDIIGCSSDVDSCDGVACIKLFRKLQRKFDIKQWSKQHIDAVTGAIAIVNEHAAVLLNEAKLCATYDKVNDKLPVLLEEAVADCILLNQKESSD